MGDLSLRPVIIQGTYIHKGYPFLPVATPRECWDEMDDFKFRASDVCVASAARNGSHWMLRIVDLIMGFDNVNFLNAPLLESVFMPVVSDPGAPRRMGYQILAEQPTDRPRVIHTHLPTTHLPKSIWTTKGVKIIHVLRNPFDALKSGFKFTLNVLPDEARHLSYFLRCAVNLDGTNCDLKTMNLPIGAWCDYVRGFWNRRHDKNLLVVHYEDLKDNFRSTVSAIGNFLERPLSPEQLDMIQERSSLEVMKALEEQTKTPAAGLGKIIDTGLSNEAIKEFSEEDIAFVKSMMRDKLAGTDIRYLKAIV